MASNNRGGNRNRGRNNNPEGRNQYSGLMGSARENPLAAAAAEPDQRPDRQSVGSAQRMARRLPVRRRPRRRGGLGRGGQPDRQPTPAQHQEPVRHRRGSAHLEGNRQGHGLTGSTAVSDG